MLGDVAGLRAVGRRLGARGVRRSPVVPDGGTSLGVPTWFYGHEPPNPFATEVAKYFKNAIREDVLLHVCTAGHRVPARARRDRAGGVPGRLRELLRRPAGAVAPMVLVGRDYWTEELPAWPLLRGSPTGREMEKVLHLVDDLEEVARCSALRLGRAARLRGMSTFSATTDSEAVVPADREAIWAALTDPSCCRS